MILVILYTNVCAQNNCTQSLKLAEKKLESGHLREVPDIVSDCLHKKLFSSEEMLKAYKLLTITYLYLDDSLNAENYFYKLLKGFPTFKINESVEPSELVNLYHTYRTLPLYSYGLQFGANISHVTPTVLYGIDNLSQRREDYQHQIGYSGGLRFEVPLTRRLFINTGPDFSVVKYKNIRSLSTSGLQVENDINYNFNEVHFSENQSWLSLPLLIGTSIGRSHVEHYLYGGASAGYLISAKAMVSRKFTNSSNSANEIKGPDVNVKSLRTGFNFSGIIGTGLKIKTGLNQVNIEAQYDMGLTNIINGSRRYSSSQLINRYGYLDNDARLSLFTLKGSYMFIRYKPKKIKQ
ncbi:MAG: PorT family protein [Bacteroidota bacterium]|nr:PorT family protein [Bacteroidota bacterium]